MTEYVVDLCFYQQKLGGADSRVHITIDDDYRGQYFISSTNPDDPTMVGFGGLLPGPHSIIVHRPFDQFVDEAADRDYWWSGTNFYGPEGLRVIPWTELKYHDDYIKSQADDWWQPFEVYKQGPVLWEFTL